MRERATRERSVSDDLSDPRIPDQEIEFRASRAGGPGGQHVNKTATRVEARWNVDASPSVTATEQEQIRAKLGARIGNDGVLRVVADDERSQLRNKLLAASRLRNLVEEALRVPKPRKPTRAPRAAVERRIASKKRRSALKQERRLPPPED